VSLSLEHHGDSVIMGVFTEEAKQKAKETWAKKRAAGYVSPLKGRKKDPKPEGWVNPRKGKKGKPHSEEIKKKQSESWRKKYDDGYKSLLIGSKQSEERRRQQSERMKKAYANGYVNPLKGKKLTAEQLKDRKNLKGEDHPLHGRTISPEQRAKISKTLTGKPHPHTDEWNKNIGAANKGRIIPPEHRAKISESLKGEKNPNYGRTGDKHPMFGKKGPLNPNFGRKRTKEQCRRISEGRWRFHDREAMLRRRITDVFVRNRLKIPFMVRITDGIMLERLGYTKQQFIDQIESTFQGGMTWENRGRGSDKWHIDHIKPVSAFLKGGITDPKEINALWNLQALWEKDNLHKSNKYNPKTLRIPVILTPWKTSNISSMVRFPIDLSKAA